MGACFTTIPTLLNRPTTACPRCDGDQIRLLVVKSESGFTWRDCEQCGYLWVIPHGWMPRRLSAVVRLGE